MNCNKVVSLAVFVVLIQSCFGSPLGLARLFETKNFAENANATEKNSTPIEIIESTTSSMLLTTESEVETTNVSVNETSVKNATLIRRKRSCEDGDCGGLRYGPPPPCYGANYNIRIRASYGGCGCASPSCGCAPRCKCSGPSCDCPSPRGCVPSGCGCPSSSCGCPPTSYEYSPPAPCGCSCSPPPSLCPCSGPRCPCAPPPCPCVPRCCSPRCSGCGCNRACCNQIPVPTPINIHFHNHIQGCPPTCGCSSRCIPRRGCGYACASPCASPCAPAPTAYSGFPDYDYGTRGATLSDYDYNNFRRRRSLAALERRLSFMTKPIIVQ